MTNFITKLPQKLAHPIESFGKQWWTLHVDGTSRASDSGVGLILQSPTRKLVKQAIRLNFSISNSKVEYEAILAGLDLPLVLIETSWNYE